MSVHGKCRLLLLLLLAASLVAIYYCSAGRINGLNRSLNDDHDDYDDNNKRKENPHSTLLSEPTRAVLNTVSCWHQNNDIKLAPTLTLTFSLWALILNNICQVHSLAVFIETRAQSFVIALACCWLACITRTAAAVGREKSSLSMLLCPPLA